MSREIDERIVAMYFDDKNFSSGAQQAIKTLDELKKSCNMEGVGKGFEAFGDINKKLNLDGIRKNTDKLKSSFEGLGRVAKNSFSKLLSPIQSVKHEIDALNGYVAKVFGIDLASKIVNGLENTFRNLTVAPISAGWGQYENTMDSIKTIMSSTGEDIDTVKTKLGEMTDYANKTIYSLNDMTSNLGKFTNNGVKLNDATNAMIGLANATADAGQGSQQASMAMYNVSQAIGVGKMTTIDWKSLENANIATVRLKNTFIQAAAASNQLDTKIVKVKDDVTGLEREETQYWTKAEKGQKSVQVTAENFRETLNKGWLDKDAMMKTFAIYSGQLDVESIAAMGFSKKLAEELYEIGQNAMKAAQEVRTFSKMMDALKEGVQSTWATSFEYIFGDMEEGTNLWTTLNEKIEKTLNEGAKNRNDILLAWRGMMTDENGQVKKIKDVFTYKAEMLEYDLAHGYISLETYLARMDELNNTIGNPELWVDYRDMAIQSFLDIFDIFKELGSTAKGAWTDVFGTFTGDTLKNITKGIKTAVDTVKQWLGNADDADSRISKIRKGLSGVFTILKVGLNAAKAALETAWSIAKPLIDPLLNLFAKFGDWIQLKDVKNFGDMIGKLSEKFKGLWDRLTKLGWKGALIKIGDWFSGVWSNIKTGVGNWLRDNGLGGVVDWFHNVKESLVTGWNNLFGEEGTVTKWWNDESNPVSNFFKNVWETVSGLFATTDADGNAITMPIVEWFNNMWKTLEDTWNSLFGKEGSVTKWWDAADNPVKKFFNDIWTTVSGLFATTDADGNAITMPIVQWFTDLWGSLEETWKSLFGENGSITKWWYAEDNPVSKFFNDVWTTVSGLFATTDVDGNAITMPIVQWFTDLWSTLEETWNSLFGKEGSITKWWDANDNPIKKFFNDVWTTVSSLFAITDADGNVITMPIVKWFTDLWSTLEETWNNLFGEKGSITSWWNATDNPIKKFFNDVWEAVSGTFESNGSEEAPIVKFFNGIVEALDSAWKSIVGWFESDTAKDIGKFFSDAWGWLMKKLGISSPDEVDANTIAGKLRKNGMNLVASTSGAPYGKKAAEQIAGSDSPLSDEEIKRVPVLDFLIRIKEAIVGAWNDVTEWFRSSGISEFFSNMWNWLTELFTKTNEGPAGTNPDGSLREKKTLIESIGEFIKGIIDSLAEAVRDIGNSEAAQAVFNTFKDIITVIGNVVDILSKWALRVTETVKTGDTSHLQLMDWLGPVLTVVGFIVKSIIDIRKTNSLTNLATAGGIMTNIGGQMLEFAGGIALIALAIKYLGTIPTDQLIQGGAAVAIIGTVLGFLSKGLTDLNNSLGKRIMPQTSGERIAKHAITAVTIAGTIAEVMALLPNILEKLQGFDGDVNGDAIYKTFTSIGLMISGIILSIGIFSKLGAGNMSIAAAAKGSLAIVAGLGILLIGLDAIIGSVLGLEGALEDLGPEFQGLHEAHLKRIRYGGEILAAFGEAIGGLFGAIGGGLAGGFDAAKGNKLAEGSKTASKILKDVSVEDMQHMADVVSVISDIQESLPDYDGLWDKWVNGDKLGLIGDNIGRLGKGLGEMIVAINPAELDPTNDIARIKGYVDLLSGFGSVMQVLFDSVNQAVNLGMNETSYFPGMIGSMMQTVLPYYRDAAEQLAIAIQEGLGDEEGAASLHFNFDPTGIITAICRSLETNGKDDVKMAVRRMIQFGLDAYSDTTDFGDPGIHSTGQIDQSLTNLFDMMTKGGEGLSLDSIVTGFLGELGDSTKLDSLLSSYSGTFDLFGTALSDKLNENIHFDMDKWMKVDENGQIAGIADIEAQWNEVLSQIGDESDAFEIKIRPVLDTSYFDDDFDKFQLRIHQSMPLAVLNDVDIGSHRIEINDTNIVNEIRMLRYDLQNVSANLQSVMYNVDGSLANHIDGVTDAVRNIRIPSVRTTLRDIDEGLYRSAINSALTGVSAYAEP